MWEERRMYPDPHPWKRSERRRTPVTKGGQRRESGATVHTSTWESPGLAACGDAATFVAVAATGGVGVGVAVAVGSGLTITTVREPTQGGKQSRRRRRTRCGTGA